MARDVRLAVEAELARRELCRRSYTEYLAYVQGKTWKRTRFSTYLSQTIQDFVEADTGNSFDILIVQAPPQHGKLCADSTPVPTPDGWKRHGDLKIGDTVFAPDGRPIKVLDEIHQVQPASLEVTFTDGAKIKVHPNHEWVVRDNINSKTKTSDITVETKYMVGRGLRIGPKGRGGRCRFSVDHNICVEYPYSEQPIHPYFLGLWLGDGSTTKPCITHSPKDTEAIEKLRTLGYEPSTVCTHKDTGVLTTHFSGAPAQAMRNLGFAHKNGEAKHIPDLYKFASKEQRLELLAGMIDSDGYVYQKNGRITISNINKQLIDDFAEVVRSLGWRATVSAASPCTSTSGIEGKHTCYQLTFNPDCSIPTALPRKKLTHTTPIRRRRGIVSIEPCEPEHGKCITVEGGVYLVGEHFTPTHNSITLTETFPSWYMGKYPNNRVILAAYNDDFAERFMRRNKEKVKAHGKNIFGIEVGKIDRATEFELSNGKGRIISRGLRSGITGNPGDLIIIDDPIKDKAEAYSPTFREQLWGAWFGSVRTRLSAGAKVIVIATPWHADDLMARLIQFEMNVKVVRIPVEAQENDPLGRKPGEALCPELGKDDKWLADFKPAYINDPKNGAAAWAAMFMCNPRIEGGNIVKRDWFRTYDPKSIEEWGPTLISVDAAFKGTEESDFVAMTVWSKLGQSYYLRHCSNKKLDFPQTLRELRTLRALYPEAFTVLVEDKANGSAIISTMRHEMPGIIAVNPKGGKEARVHAVASVIESGNVFLPEGASWTEEYLDQWAGFPAVPHDDMVDSSTQALSHMLFSSGDPLYLAKKISEEEQMLRGEEDAFLDGDFLYDVYGRDSWA